ncbi:MAG: hypothetical protein LBD25_08930 [Coriobacteriales bacterium]|jgi:trigger factor|nr:hypothetical protein [Coriobacteriales bacterium]
MPKLSLKIVETPVDGGKVQLEVTVPGSVTADIAAGAAVALAMQHKIDLSNVEVHDLAKTVRDTVGEAQHQAFLNEYTMTSLAPFAVAERGLEIVMDPVTSSSEDLHEGSDFCFRALVTLKPRFELSSYEPVTVKAVRPSVTEEEVAEQLSAIAQRFASSVPDASAHVRPGDDVVIRIAAWRADDGQPIEAMTAERRAYTLGDGFLPQAFDNGLMGARPGEERELAFELPGMEGPRGEAGRGIATRAKVTVLQIAKKVTPVLTDAWVAANIPDAGTLEGLRERIRSQGLEYKSKQAEDRAYFLTATALATRLEGHIPDELYAYTHQEMLQSLRAQIEASGVSLKEFAEQRGIPEQQFSMQMMLETRERLRQSFSLDALARHLGLVVEEGDIDEALKRMAPGNEAALRKEFEGTGRAYLLNEAALRTKANKWLVETAVYEYE